MSPIVANLLELLKYTLPALIVLLATYMVVNKFLINDTERKRLAIFGDHVKTTIPMRLQAYERLTLFLERIKIQDLMAKLYHPSKTAQDVQLEILQLIRTEFEYNLSQQIYVSKEVWQTVVTAKEQEIAMVNQVAASLPPNSNAKALFEKLTEVAVIQDDQTPREIAIDIVNGEAKKVLLQS